MASFVKASREPRVVVKARRSSADVNAAILRKPALATPPAKYPEIGEIAFDFAAKIVISDGCC